MVSQKFRFSDFSKRFKAIENISAGDFVYTDYSEVEDNFQIYLDDAGIQAVWVDSDAVNMMVSVGVVSGFSHAFSTTMEVNSTNGLNDGDYIDKTIVSKNLTGYTIHMIVISDEADSVWEFLLSSGANAATDNVKKSLVFSNPTYFEHISFTIASMTADNGTYNPAANTHVGFRCVEDVTGDKLKVAKIWYEKSGTTYSGIKKASSDLSEESSSGSHSIQVIGITPSAITANSFGKVIMLGPVIRGYSDLITGFLYGVNDITAGLPSWLADTNVSQKMWGNFAFYRYFAIAVSETELMLKDMPFTKA